MSEDTRAWKDQYMLRFPEGMRDQLKAAAGKNNRSMNAEMVFRLDAWDGVVQQLELAQQGWDEAKSKVESQREHIEVLQAELLEAVTRYDNLEDRLTEDRMSYRETIAEAHRLEQHWRDEAAALRQSNDRLRAELATEKAMGGHKGGSDPDQENTLYMLMDFDGRPTSWAEISTHLAQLSAAGSFTPTSVEARILNASIESGSEREDQWWGLQQYYRALRTEHVEQEKTAISEIKAMIEYLEERQKAPEERDRSGIKFTNTVVAELADSISKYSDTLVADVLQEVRTQGLLTPHGERQIAAVFDAFHDRRKAVGE